MQYKAKCIYCKKVFVSVRNGERKYCSNKCQALFQSDLKLNKWLIGQISPLNTFGLLRPWARRYLLNKANNKCEMCGWDKINMFTHLVPLEIDHIDGNHNNNSQANLRVLCPNCHSLTSSFKGLNRGNGRKKNALE